MRRLIAPVAFSLCLLLLVSQHPVIAKDSWITVRTKNFSLIGNAGEKDIRKVGLKLEQFREVFTRLFPKMRFNTPVPTTVVVFKSDSSYGPFKPGPNIAGYFQPGPDDIEITTYDPKSGGEITCGPRKPESMVVVCYVPNTDKRLGADGVLKSVEFVPGDFKLK